MSATVVAMAPDLTPLLDRRHALRLLAGAGLVAVGACGREASSSTATPAATTTKTPTPTDCADPIPEETAGPYPGDGSNGPNVLSDDGVVRRDIRSSFGSGTGTAEGVDLDIELTIVDAAKGCTPMAGAAVYLWHCDRGGLYSLYSRGATAANYLRGVQVADADGRLTFTSVFPGAYSGRYPHIHFEVFASLADARGGAEPIATSQLALPEDACQAAYATTGYEASVRNLAATPLARDNVFSDGAGHQLATMSGRADAGFTASLTVPV
jgi:protocatechuate 3,4-dioxygenase beta subunit